MIKIDRSKTGLRLIALIAITIIALFLSPLLLGLFLLLSRSISFDQLYPELNTQMSNPSFLLLMQGLQTLMVFILPPFLLNYWYGEKNSTYLKLVKAKPLDILLAVFSLLAAIPLINFLVSWNQDIQLPSFLAGLEKWMRTAEDNAEYTTELMLQGKSWSDLLWQLLVVAIMAGLGEELLFREAYKVFSLLRQNTPGYLDYCDSFQLDTFSVLWFCPSFVAGSVVWLPALLVRIDLGPCCGTFCQQRHFCSVPFYRKKYLPGNRSRTVGSRKIFLATITFYIVVNSLWCIFSPAFQKIDIKKEL
jgi:membrane protease YdiL (CAAX protease family)